MNRLETKTGDEDLARLLLRAALGVQATTHDDGSQPGMYDLDILYPDGRPAAAEVVSTRDRIAMWVEDSVAKIGYIPRPELTRMWAIVVHPGAPLHKLRRTAPRQLAQLEKAGIKELRSFRDPWPEQLRSLGVARCWSLSPTDMYPPGFFFNPPATWAIVGDGDDAVRACEELLARAPDVTQKLLASRVSERHVVVVVTADKLGPFGSIDAGAMPTMPPTLPEGVDRLWMVTLKFLPIRAVYWLGDGVWRETVLRQEDLAGLSE